MEIGKVARKEELDLAACDCGAAAHLRWSPPCPDAVGDEPAVVRKVGAKEEALEDALPGLLGLTRPPRVCAGVLRHPEGPHRELAVPDLRPRRSAKVSAVPEERGSAEAHPERDKMGPR